MVNADYKERNEGGLRVKGVLKQSASSKPLVSIITAVYNGEKYLEETILSVLGQTYEHVEYIIIDGGSADGTVEIIKKYEAQIDYWFSEKDEGIYNAWNKGLNLARGEIIGFVNADDYYEHDTLMKVVPQFENNSLLITYGNTQYIEEHHCGGMNKGHFNPSKIYSSFGFMHTTVFASRAVYELVGKFNESYRIAGDVDWLLRAFKNNIEFGQCNNLTYMRTGGISQLLEKEAYREFGRSLNENKFSKVKIFLAKIKINTFYKIKSLIGINTMMALRNQIINIVISLFNLLYNYLPFFTIKRLFLQKLNMPLGKNTYIHTPVTFFTIGKFQMGDNSTIGPNCYLDNRGNISIGNNVSISHLTKIYTAGHEINNPCFSFLVKPVVIEDNVVIFTNVLIMPGVKIAKNAVVLAGSVVAKDVEESCVVGGNPAIFIKMRDTKIEYTINHGLWFVR